MAVIVHKTPISAIDRPQPHYKFGIFLIVIGLIVLTLIMGAIFLLIYVAKHYHDSDKGHEIFTDGQSAIRLVTRNEWIAQPPNNPLTYLKLPVSRIIIAETQTNSCSNQSECIYRVRMIQEYHIFSRRFDDIAYNFLVGGDGAVYVGRGWNKQGAHTHGYNSGSIGIALIGSFKRHTPPARQFDELKLLLAEGVRLGKITEDYKLYGQFAFTATDSPGEKVVNEIETWPHYENKYFIET